MLFKEKNIMKFHIEEKLIIEIEIYSKKKKILNNFEIFTKFLNIK